jgi:hypothetical protein
LYISQWVIAYVQLWYHRPVTRVLPLLIGFWMLAAPPAIADSQEAIARARALYNERKFEAAIDAAEEARTAPEFADSADLIAARAYLERFRATADAADLGSARDRLRRVMPERLNARERSEFVVGLGQALYFDEAAGAAADVFASILDDVGALPLEARERVLDWWASALDREAREQAEESRRSAYEAVIIRMRAELGTNPGSAVAAYWLAAAAWGNGDLQSAWDAAQAGWVRAPLAADHGAALRGDLDRLMQRGIVPDRARVLGQPIDAVRADWESFKERWTR